jgi:hypothetical protein
MTQIEAALKEFSVVLKRRDLEDGFSRLSSERDWHRLAERVSQFNKLGQPVGVDFVLLRDTQVFTRNRVCYRS